MCRGVEMNGMVGAGHGRGMARVNQTRPRCVNQMGKTHSKLLAARHGRGTAWARHGRGMLCVNPPLKGPAPSIFTYSMKQSPVLLEKLTGSQLIKNFPAFYGTRRFISAFTSARHLSLF
jgi:hypothetical protein